jgi:hypothetical protein
MLQRVSHDRHFLAKTQAGTCLELGVQTAGDGGYTVEIKGVLL